MIAKKSSNFLRQLREERGWSQKRVADLLHEIGGIADSKLIGKWERGKHVPSLFYQEKLCAIFGLTTYELGFIQASMSSNPISVDQPMLSKIRAGQRDVTHKPYSSILGYEDMFNAKRRELLQLLTIAAATFVLPLPNLDWEHIESAFTQPSYLDETVLHDLAIINKSFWNLFKVTSQKKVMLDGVLGQLKSLTNLLENSHTASVRKQLGTFASSLSQLLGEIFFDSNDYDMARSCYTFAASAAKEANHYDLWACSLIRYAFLPIYEGRYQEALPLLQAAQKLAHRGDTQLTTRHWGAAVFSDALAGVGNLYACQQALDQMDRVVDTEKSGNGGWLRFDGSRLLEQRGACFVKLKQADLAIPSLQEALKQDLTPRRRGLILTDLGLASLQNGNVEQACGYVDQVIGIAAQGSGMLRKGIYSLRLQLGTYAETNAVKRLDRQLQLLA